MDNRQEDLTYLEVPSDLPLTVGQMLARLQGLQADVVFQWLLRQQSDEANQRTKSEIAQGCATVGDILLRERGFGYAEGLLRMEQLVKRLIETFTTQQEHERARDIDEHRAGGSE